MLFGYSNRLLPLFWRLVLSNTLKKSVDLRMRCSTFSLYYLWWYLSIHDNLYLFRVLNELLKGQMVWVILWREITYVPTWRHKQADWCELCIVINSPLREQHISVSVKDDNMVDKHSCASTPNTWLAPLLALRCSDSRQHQKNLGACTHTGFLPAEVVEFFTRTGITAAGGQFDFERCTRKMFVHRKVCS